jgi:hypothetical protein
MKKLSLIHGRHTCIEEQKWNAGIENNNDWSNPGKQSNVPY